MAKHLFSSSFRTRRDRRNSVSTGSFAPDGQDDAVMRRTPLARAGAFAMALLMAFSPMQQTQAQIIADPNAPRSQQPVILPTANGLPQVNIQTPSAGGVSRNTYSQFDVQQQGAILNNARTNVQTQLGGWVQANPYLATGTARVILNEVNSSNPSQLRGYVEVAGDRAQVVIANPAGVTCDGCGFVNANRVTLTSGSAMVNGGSLDGYAVRGGNVIVQGGGLDASQADYTDIIARAVQINAGIWSKELRISTGVNQVNADHTQVSASSSGSGSGSGSAPAFAIDVAQLGGMYANKIVLIGTETGLGMRNAGTLLASSSDLVLQNNGWLSNSGSMQAGGNLQVTTQGDFSNSGTTYAGNDQTLHVATQINNSGALLAQGNNSITADSFNSGSGSVLGAGIKSDGSYATSGSLSVTTTHALAANGQNLAAADLGLSGSSVDLSGSQTDAANITLSASSGGVSTASASVATGGTLSISAASTGSSGLDNSQGKLIAGQLAFDVASLNNNHGQIQQIGTGASSIAMTSATGVIDNGNGTLASNGSLSLSAAALNNDAGRISSGGSLSITQSAASGILSNRSGTLIANDDVTLNGAIVDNTRGTLIAINGNLAVTSSGVTRNDGGIMQAGLDATLNNTGLSNGLATGADASSASAYGSISAATLHIDTAGQALSNTGGTLAASQSASIISGAFDNSGGLVQSGGDLSIDTQGAMLTNSNAADYLNSNAQLNGQGGIVAQGVTTIAAGNLINDAGYLGSRGNLNARLNTLRNSAGRVLAQSDLSLTLQGDVSNSGQLITGGTLDLRAGNIDNTASGEITGTLTKISASGTLTNRGLIDGSDTRIDADTVNNIGSGRIYGDHLSIAANTLRNDTETVNGVTQAATIAARNRLDLGIAGTLTNREHALIYSAGDMAIGGSLDSNRNATGAAGTINNNSATIEAGGALSMSSAVLNNTNEHLAYQVVIDKQRAVSDFVGTDGGVIDSSEVSFVINYPNPGYDMGTGKLIPVSAGITDAQRTYYFGPDPITRSVCNGGGDNETCTPEVVNIGLNDPMWGYFGITPPTTTGLVCIVENGDGCVAAQREAAWYTLQNKVSELRATVNAAIVYFKVSRDYTETTYKAEVTSTDPARIASGGAMTLNTSGTLLNANSNILAGGALNIIGAAVNNQALQVTTNTTFSGTSRDYAIVGKDCGGWFSGCSDIWQVRTMAYNAAQPHVVNLSVAQSIGNTAVTSSTSGAATRSNASVNAGSSNGSNAGGRGNGAILAYPLAVTSADGSNIVRTNDQAIQLPDSSLYQTKPDPSASYLIETDPRFSNQRQWLNSSYLTQSLSLDPGVTQKRLGDGYYEQQLIRDQVAQLTGRRFLGNYSSDEAQYQALMNNAISFAQQTNLQPGIALTAEQVAQLTSDIVWLVQKTVTLADGTTQNVLVPQLYVVARAGDLDSSGSLLAGSDVNLQLSGDLSNSGQIAGRQVVQINAANIKNLGGSINGDTVNVVAQQDLNNTGGSISAVSNLTALAGRDLNVASTVQSTDSAVMQRQDVDRVAGLYVTGATGVLQAGAGRDVNLTAAAIVNNGTGTTVVAAGNNLNLNSVQTVDSINATWNAQNYSRYGTQSEVGSAINGGGAVQLVAGNDLTARAATVQATGALIASAGNDLNISAGQTTQSLAQGYHAEGSGLLQSASVTSRTSLVSTQAEASNFGGNTVNLQAGHDINVVGSNVVGDNAVNLNAQNNLNIVAAVNTMQQSSFKEETKSGLMGSGGIGITIGSQKHSLDQQVDSTGVAASTIGSTQGNVTLNAGEIYQQTGSDVLAPAGDVSIAAKQINIVAGVGTSRTESEDHFEQSGLTLAVTGAAVSALQGVQQMAQAASKTKSTRMKALAAASAGMGVANGVAAQAAANAKGSSGIGLSITVGGSQSDSNSVQQSTSLRGSQVSAGGNVSLNASGDSQTSDITVIASNIKAGQETSLSAEHDINLLGGESVDEQRSKHSSLSYGAGLAIEFNTSGGAAFGFTANAAGSRGNSDGRDVAQIQSQISGDQKVTLVSGNDTTLRSAVVSGKQVSADVGNNLNIVSVQDTSSYASKDQSLSGSMTVGFGFSGSLNASMGRVNADFASVAQQSGIAAGDGGFQLVVNGNTDLQGGKISSTQAAIDSNSNSLTTGSLTASNIDNKSQYKAESISIGTGGQGTSGGIGYSAGSQQSTTYSSISGGQINIDEAAQQAKTGQSASEALAAVDRSGLTGKDSSNSLIKDWNGQELQADVTAQAQIMQAFGQQAAKAIGDYAGNKSESLKTEAKAAMLNGDTARAEQLTAEAANWDEGGAYRVALHAATGALGGGVGGALGAAVSSAAMPEISKAINGMGLPDVVQKGLEQVVATALGAAVGGAAGAVSGVNVEANNRQMTHTEKDRIKALAKGDAQAEAKLTAAACALVHCSAEYAKGSAEYNYYSQIEKLGSSPALSGERDTLSQQTGLFGYTTNRLNPLSDINVDGVKQFNNTYQLTTRAGGLLQTAGGVTSVVGGVAMTAGGAVLCPETGVGCVFAAGGATLIGWGLDQSKAGVTTSISGQPQTTLGASILANTFGMSSESAELLYGMIGFIPVTGGAVVVNKAVNAEIAAGSAGREANAAARPVTAENFFDGTQYTPKVLKQAASGDYHGFPQSIDAFSGSGTVTSIVGGDGVTRLKLTIPGAYNGQAGVFEYIRNPDGTINHRLFVPNK
jgi:filamentous hemagglutinin